jgi:DNA-binding MarR family transcriptional regulator
VKQKKDDCIQEGDKDFGLWRLLDHTRFMISRLREQELDQVGLTPEQGHILDILNYFNGSATMNQLMNITMRRHHSISTQIDRMTKQGLVKKKKNSRDRREYSIIMTDKGREVFKRIKRDSIIQAFSCLSEDDKKALDTRLKSLLIHAYNLHGKQYQQTFPQ